MRISRWVIAAAVAALAASLVAGAAFGGSNAPAAQNAGYKAGLVGDVGTFNDNGFNKNQVLGIKAAAKAIHGKAYTYDSHGSNDYQPNFQHAVADGNKLIIAAGFLLGDTVKAFAQQYPNIKFAIPTTARQRRRVQNEEGITYAAERAGCPSARSRRAGQECGKKEIGGRRIKLRRSTVDAVTALPERRFAEEDADPVLEQLMIGCVRLAQERDQSGAQVISKSPSLRRRCPSPSSSARGIGVDTDGTRCEADPHERDRRPTPGSTTPSCPRRRATQGRKNLVNLQEQRVARSPRRSEEASGVVKLRTKASRRSSIKAKVPRGFTTVLEERAGFRLLSFFFSGCDHVADDRSSDERIAGASRSNDDVSFDVRRGEAHALLGENGAGKTDADEHPVRPLPRTPARSG